jgi:hypothetical protein
VCTVWLPVSGFSSRRPGFDFWAFHVTFMKGKVALGRIFLQVCRYLLSSHQCSGVTAPEVCDTSGQLVVTTASVRNDVNGVK